ncbi:uncharacterized protein LOC143901472 [Temnothorax americanus]|uniref:uncharacterized protein LOC143901472 n=1 Tax=Temnothorax americanus TaxID=1964332 RepID=UPI004068CC42
MNTTAFRRRLKVHISTLIFCEVSAIRKIIAAFQAKIKPFAGSERIGAGFPQGFLSSLGYRATQNTSLIAENPCMLRCRVDARLADVRCAVLGEEPPAIIKVISLTHPGIKGG